MTDTHPLMFALAVVGVWFMFMIIPLVAATLTMDIQQHSLLIIYGLWAVSVLVCMVLMTQFKK